MSKKARNVLIAVVVVAVVVCAALFVVIQGKNKKPAAPTDATVASTEALVFTEPEIPTEEDTTDIIDQILQTMDGQSTTQSQNAPTQVASTTAANTTQANGQQTPSTTAKATTTKAAATTKATATTKASKPTTTKATKTTTKKSTTSTTAPSGKDPITTVNGVDAMSSGGVVSYLWNPEGNFYYVEDNPWQRNFGFNVIYDWSAAMLVMYYDTWRACFDYDGLEWMIQAWKGQYGFLFIGGEIGVYTRKPGQSVVTSSHYDCADDNHLINMEMSIHFDAHDGNGYKKLFTRSYYPHWWATGFVDGHLADYKFNDRSCLVQTARLTMYDQDMLNAFTTALEGCGFRRVGSRSEVSTASSDTFTVVGLDVYYSWKNIDQGYKTR